MRMTFSGRAVVVLSLCAFLGGLQLANNLLFCLGCLGFGLVIACLLRCRVNLFNLQAERRLPFPVHAGSEVSSSILIRNTSKWFSASFVCIEDHVSGTGVSRKPLLSAVTLIPPGADVTTWQTTKFHRRGEKEFTSLTFFSQFPLSLFRYEFTIELSQTLVAYPRLKRIGYRLMPDIPDRQWERTVPSRPRHQQEEFAGLREFREGDNPKWIHWKSSGRADGRLLVKEFEGSALKRARVVLDAYLPEQSAKGERQLERAIEVAASLAQALAGQRFVTTFIIRSSNEFEIEVRPHDRSLFSLFRHLALLEPARSPSSLGYSPGLPTLHIDPAKLGARKKPERELAWR